MATRYRKDSFLRNAEFLDNQFLGINKIPRIPRTGRDAEYEIEPQYAERPDRLAHDVYGNSRYWWVFAARNPDVLKDPIRDFQSGVKIILPAESSVVNKGAVG